MPYKRHSPVPESEMDRERYHGHYTICQYLRDIYHLTDDPEIRMKCRIGMAMTKAMNQKLQDYKHFFEWVERLQKEGIDGRNKIDDKQMDSM